MINVSFEVYEIEMREKKFISERKRWLLEKVNKIVILLVKLIFEISVLNW